MTSGLLRAVSPEGGYDQPAMLGHAALWDPLFLVWGTLLLLGLRRRTPDARLVR